MKKNWWLYIVLLAILIVVGFWVWQSFSQPKIVVTDFKTCTAAGRPIMESYPRQCNYQGESYTEDIGNELDKLDLIKIGSPRPNSIISSPLHITGEAVGNWYFEASFPIKLFGSNNVQLAEGIAQAQGDWMTTNFVPFTATLNFPSQPTNSTGTLVLYKDNPSGEPQNDNQLVVPITF